MALDFVMLDDAGLAARADGVSVYLDEHEALMALALTSACQLVYRCHDYWSDVVFETGDLKEFAAECERLVVAVPASHPHAADLVTLIGKLRDLASRARQRGYRLQGVAD